MLVVGVVVDVVGPVVQAVMVVVVVVSSLSVSVLVVVVLATVMVVVVMAIMVVVVMALSFGLYSWLVSPAFVVLAVVGCRCRSALA